MPQSRQRKTIASAPVAVLKTVSPHMLATKPLSKRRQISRIRGIVCSQRQHLTVATYARCPRPPLQNVRCRVRCLMSATMFRIALSKTITGSFIQGFAPVSLKQSHM
jgi:hypothetical protein